MIGAGVFTTSGYTLADLGSPHRVLIAWAAGGLLAACGAIAYGSLIRDLTESGGEYVFLARTVHPIIGVAAGLVSFIAGFTGAIAFAARVCAEYLVGDVSPATVGFVAAGLVAVGTAAPLVGLRVGMWTQNAILAGLLAVLLVLVGTILPTVLDHPGRLYVETPAPPLAAYARALVWIALSYSGFNAAIYIAEEVTRANRTVPRALVSGTLLVTALYLLLNLVILAAPAELVSGQKQIATIAATEFGSERLATAVRWAIAAATATSVLVGMTTGPRVYAKMAADGVLPVWFATEPDSVPRRAILAQAICVLPAAFFGQIVDFLFYLGLTLSISAAATASCVFLRPTTTTARAAAAVFVAATLLLAAIAAWDRPGRAIAALATVGLGLVFGWQQWRKRPRPER